MEAFTARHSSWRLALLFALSFGFVALCFILATMRAMSALDAGANRRLTGGDVPLGLTGMGRGFAQALDAIQHFRREF